MKKTNIGGQAVLEGVMMQGSDMYALAVRNTSNEIVVETTQRNKKYTDNKFCKLPIIRGVVAFANSMVVGVKIIGRSAELAGLDDETENPSKFEQWLIDKLGDNLNNVLIGFSMVVALIFSMILFAFLPVWVSSFVTPYLNGKTWAISIVEGIMRMLIFLIYILIISRNKEIQRTFMYHGAEHKTINCFEAEDELTVENVKKHTRLHKRCGTSFIIIVMLISIVFFMFVPTDDVMTRIGSRILFVPFVAGLSYEALRWAGRSDNIIVRIFSYPGLMLQKITTKEPDDGQIEVAIAAMEKVLEFQEG